MHTQQSILKEFNEEIKPTKRIDILNLESSLRSRWKGTFFTQDPNLIHMLNQIEVVAKSELRELRYI